MVARSLAVVVVACMGISSLVAQQGDVVVRVRSLAPFTAPWLQLSGEIVTAMPGDQAVEMSPRLDAVGSPEAPTWVLELLGNRHREAIDAGRLAVRRTRGDDGDKAVVGDLVLSGSAAEVEVCERELDAIAAGLGRPIEITAWRLPLGDGALPPTTWDAAALQRALKERPPLWTAHGRTRTGGALRLGQERGIGMLRDIDVEVAQGNRISDPKVDLAFAGLRATLVVDALPGDELVLRGSWLLSEPLSLREQSAGDVGAVDLPDHRNAWVTFAGRVPNGGALVVAGRGGPVGPDGFLLVLGARLLTPAVGDAVAGLMVRPIGALLARSTAWPRLDWYVPGDDSPSFGPARCDGGFAAGGLVEMLEMPAGAAQLAGAALVLQVDGEAGRRVDAVLHSLAANLVSGTLCTRVADVGSAPLELVQPLLAGRSAAAFVGRERSIVRDHEVEIAKEASGSNPVIGIVRSGLWLGAVAARTGAGWHMTGSWSVAAYDEPRSRELDGPPSMRMQLVDFRTTTLPWDAPMPVGQDHALGDGPAWTARGAATRITVQLIAP